MNKEKINVYINKAHKERDELIKEIITSKKKYSDDTLEAITYIETNIDVLKYKHKDLSFIELYKEISYILKFKKGLNYDENVINKLLSKHRIYNSYIVGRILFIVYALLDIFLINDKLLPELKLFTNNIVQNILGGILHTLIIFMLISLTFLIIDFFKIKFYNTPKIDDISKS